jgi:hypothetical protein
MKQTLSIKNLPSVSIVIPTIGNINIHNTVNELNMGTLVPNEIIICIPVECFKLISFLEFNNNVRILQTSVKGQVAQRAEGFKVAVSNIVIQLDDDISLEKTAIELLVEALTLLGPGNVVGPVFLDEKNGNPFHAVSSGLNGFLLNIFYSLICGAKWGRSRIGTVSSSGIGFGVSIYSSSEQFVKTEWLPGGCVGSYRVDLISDNFFPFSGKAFYEDFIHSHLRNKANFQHWVVRCAVGRTASAERIQSIESFNKNRIARRYYVKNRSFSNLRLFIYEAIEWIRFYINYYIL